jgi:hypothetical protein
LGSHRYGILHLGGRDAADLHDRCARASALLGWPTPNGLPADGNDPQFVDQSLVEATT